MTGKVLPSMALWNLIIAIRFVFFLWLSNMDQRVTNVWKTTFLGSVVLRGRGGSPTWKYWFDDHQRLVEERILVLSIRCLGRAEYLPFQVEVILKLRAAGLVQRRNLSSHGEKINLQISGLITAFNYLERLPGEGRIQHERNSFHLGVNVQRSGGVRRRFGCGPFGGNLVRHPQLLVVMIGRIRWHRLKSDATESKKKPHKLQDLGHASRLNARRLIIASSQQKKKNLLQ